MVQQLGAGLAVGVETRVTLVGAYAGAALRVDAAIDSTYIVAARLQCALDIQI
jgi:hypothetical protein